MRFRLSTKAYFFSHQDVKCIQQIRALLNTLAEDNANDKTKALVKKILSDDSSEVGLVINER